MSNKLSAAAGSGRAAPFMTGLCCVDDDEVPADSASAAGERERERERESVSGSIERRIRAPQHTKRAVRARPLTQLEEISPEIVSCGRSLIRFARCSVVRGGNPSSVAAESNCLRNELAHGSFCRRWQRPTGVARVAVPNLRRAVENVCV